MLGEPLFCWGVGLGLVMPLGQFPPNVALGLLASVRVSYYIPVTCTIIVVLRLTSGLFHSSSM